jgi:hypothetical protein
MYWERLVTADDFTAEAGKWLRYHSRPGGGNIFSERVGYTAHGAPWDGAFIDCVAQDAGVYVPSLINPSSGLAEFFWARRIVNSPRPGDIVFFAFGTDAQFGPAHVGIVTGAEQWKSSGCFSTIEANVAGQGKTDDRDGVHLRTRWQNDVIAFGRPAFLRRKKKPRPGIGSKSETGQLFREPRPGIDSPVLTGLVFSKIEKQARSRRRSEDIELIQRALAGFGGMRGANPGLWDSATESAMARFQRRIGYVGDRANGKPDWASLEVLGRISRTFSILP